MCAAVLFIFSKFLSGSHSKLHLHCCFLHCCSWFCFIFSQLLLSLTHWTSPVHQSEKSPCRHWFLSFSFSSPFSPFPILVFFFFSPPVFHIGSLFLSGSPSSPLTAEAPGHFLSGLPAAPHHHQPHRPLPPSERSSHAQAFPCATHHPGHALGAALSLQSMRPPWNQPPPPFSSRPPPPPPHTHLFLLLSPPLSDPASRREELGRPSAASPLLWNFVFGSGDRHIEN